MVERKPFFAWYPVKVSGEWMWFDWVGIEIDYRPTLNGYPPIKSYFRF